MPIRGRCYCGQIEYEIAAEPLFGAQCHCREGQYFTGGHPHLGMGVPATSFRYTRGQPARYRRSDISDPVTREFCPTCGTHLAATTPPLPDVVLVQPGTLDDPSVFGRPEVVTFTREAQPFHHIPEGAMCFETIPYP